MIRTHFCPPVKSRAFQCAQMGLSSPQGIIFPPPEYKMPLGKGPKHTCLCPSLAPWTPLSVSPHLPGVFHLFCSRMQEIRTPFYSTCLTVSP